MGQLLFIIVGAVLLIWGVVAHIVALIVIGVVLLAIGGVWVFFLGDFGDGPDFFDW